MEYDGNLYYFANIYYSLLKKIVFGRSDKYIDVIPVIYQPNVWLRGLVELIYHKGPKVPEDRIFFHSSPYPHKCVIC